MSGSTSLSPSPSPSLDHLSANRPSTSRHTPYHAPSLFLSQPTPSSILKLLEDSPSSSPKGKGTNLRSILILSHSLRYAVEHCDLELLTWLTTIGASYDTILDDAVQELENDEGWGIIGMAIQASCGRQDAEEAVRLLVGRWGMEAGQRQGRDHSGWTPLHLASIISTPPLVSFLLNRGASPHALSNLGLTPLDLVSGMPERTDIAVFLEHSSTAALVPSAPETSLSSRRQAMLARRRNKAAQQLAKMDEKERQARIEAERQQWIEEVASIVEVSPELLIRRRSSEDSGIGSMDSDSEDGDDEGEEPDPDAHLAFSLNQLTGIFDIFITTYRPQCSPIAERTLPANALYLYAKFAHNLCDDAWLEELIEGTIERIEQGVYSHVEDLAYLAFWAYNTTVLLHLLRSDEDLGGACETLNLLSMLEELINAIHVFVIRVAERRIDELLDAAFLDYEALDELNDVRFEGEWSSIFRSFGGKKKRDVPKATDLFDSGTAPGSPSSLLGSIREAASPLKTLASKPSIQDLMSISAPRSISMDSLATIHNTNQGHIKPKSVTDILSGVLLVLHLYQVNPALIIQVFSQVFFWISCELFNRILNRKKYLCRSKAVQIRMNITILEDWVRANGLPVRIAMKHLEPVNQLLTWLQCLSQVREFDTLIGTMQSLKGINPLQMRKAVRDYRYEVNEGRMTEECAQYLSQLQKDWLRSRTTQDAQGDDSTPIDSLFDGTISLGDFVPQSAPEVIGELLDSRFMLPFQLPSDVESLVAAPPDDAAFANLAVDASRPSSRSSVSSTRAMGWTLPTTLRRLPSDFFPWLKNQQTSRRLQRDSLRPRREMAPAMDPPLGPSPRISIPHRSSQLSAVSEDDATPITTSIASPASFPAASPSPMRPSGSLDQMREKTKIPFEVVEFPTHVRENSFELKVRRSISPLKPAAAAAGPDTPTRLPQSAPSAQGHYDLARHRREQFSQSPTSAIGERDPKWWKMKRSPSSSSSLGSGDRQRREASEDTVVAR